MVIAEKQTKVNNAVWHYDSKEQEVLVLHIIGLD